MLRRYAIGLIAALAMISCSGLGSQSSGTPPTTSEASATAEPGPVGSPRRLRLLTADQYLNTVAYIFGPDIKLEARFSPLPRTKGLLANGAALAGVTGGQLEQYQKNGALLAAQVVDPEHRNFLISCKPIAEDAADKTCATKFLASTGRLLYRRPMSPARIEEMVARAGEAADRLKDFYAGLAVALEGMLISPEVLLVAEMSEPDPKRPGRQRLDAYSLASRLSLFLWNAAPDSALLDAAASGELHTEKGRARIVSMMLASPRLETGMRAFFDDMFGFDEFGTLAKDPAVYPFFTGLMVTDAREQTLRTLIEHLLAKKQDYRDLYTTRSTFMSPALAALYQVPAGPDWAPFEFPPDSPRAGLLTQVSFLAVHSHPGRSSATLRGKALRELLLCQTVPRPPPNVDFSLVENPKSNYRTSRDRVNAHLTNPVCAGCHKITDPMGLALENFDGAGRYRDNEKGAPIDSSGSLDGKLFTDVGGLGAAVRDHPALPSCLVERLFSYGSGGPAVPEQRPLLSFYNARFAAAGYKLPELLRSIAMSAAFSDVVESPPPTGEKSVRAPGPQLAGQDTK